MSEKKRMTTWVPTIVMGVVAILFSVYALQEQTELQRVREETNKLKADLNACQQELADQKAKTTAMFEDALRQSKIALAEAEMQYSRALQSESSKKK